MIPSAPPQIGLTRDLQGSTRGQISDETTAITEKLTSIWQRVLARSEVRPDQHFFEAGGDPASVIHLFDQIRAEFARTIPPLAIYTAPTIQSLACLLSKEEPVRFSNVLLLKAGFQPPPAFFISGLGGNVMEFFALLKYIDWAYPSYGLQARGSDGLEPPLDQIEGMARYHLEGIRGLQAHGPYLLCGHSFGGLVALEIARQLKEAGEEIAMLAMIDSYPFTSPLSVGQRLKCNIQRAYHRAAQVLQPSSEKHKAAQLQQVNEKLCGPAIKKVYESDHIALRSYHPKPYPGKVLFFRAGIETGLPGLAAWRGLIEDLQVRTVPGSHRDMLRTEAPDLASAISRFAKTALR